MTRSAQWPEPYQPSLENYLAEVNEAEARGYSYTDLTLESATTVWVSVIHWDEVGLDVCVGDTFTFLLRRITGPGWRSYGLDNDVARLCAAYLDPPLNRLRVTARLDSVHKVKVATMLRRPPEVIWGSEWLEPVTCLTSSYESTWEAGMFLGFVAVLSQAAVAF